MSAYSRIQYEERIRIETYLGEGFSVSEIARRLDRSKSSISRELKRLPRYYCSTWAENQASLRARRKCGPGKIDSNENLKRAVLDGLRKRWSPDQISSHLRLRYPDDPTMHVSHETIYTYIYVLPRGELRAELTALLRQQKKSRFRRAGPNEKRGKLREMISIEERPKAVAKRSLPGHWEGDLLVGSDHKSVLGTLVERKTRAVILVPIKKRNATTVRAAFERALKKLPQQMKRSLTYDQGTEMAEHKLFEVNTKMKVYFCHPASPWERGTCENTNGLIRHYFPKKTDFSKITTSELKRVQDELNERPRKTLAYHTPKEVFDREILKLLR